MKAIALFSGGLDSSLAIKMVSSQGIEVVAFHFFTPFCTCNRANRGCGSSVEHMADQLGVELKIQFLGEEYLGIVKHPRYGYGKNFNPCIDCRILILKKAKEYMHKVGASFLITGEVLGQRPKSQHRKALRIIEKEADLEGLILRPLSAKLLAPTIPEKEGWIDREKLLDFYGRTRKPQMKLANIFGLKDYPCSSGGCLLTDPCFSKRLKDLLEYNPEVFNLRNVELLKIGRHFRLAPHFKLIVGRDERENNRLQKLIGPQEVVFQPQDVGGPLGVGEGILNKNLKILSSQIIARYVSSSNGRVKIKIRGEMWEEEVYIDKPEKEMVEEFRI